MADSINDLASDPNRFQEAVHWLRQRIPITEADYQALTEAERRRAFMVALAAQADEVQAILDGIIAAVEEGTTFDDFKEFISDKLTAEWATDDAPALETVFRTNVQSAYNAGRYRQAIHPVIGMRRPFWKFVAIEDDRTSDVCDDCNDTILPAADNWWNSHHPPLHFNCRSTFIPLSDDEAKEEGLDDEGPQADADDGFGDAPDRDDANDWRPDPSNYSKDLADILKDKLAR